MAPCESVYPWRDLSVVLPVHNGTAPDHFGAALESLLQQTVPPDEIIVVEDGPLCWELERVAACYEELMPQLCRIALPRSAGAAAANDAGLRAATRSWIAKMDADDISLPTRFECQLATAAGGEWDIIGAAMVEFDNERGETLGIRRLPTEPASVRRYAKFNNPVNHPCVLYRRQLALGVGGYREVSFAEDYDLMVRMLLAGARVTNLPLPVLLFRSGDAMLRRRKVPIRFEVGLQLNFVSYGFISRRRAVVNVLIRTIFRAMPLGLMRRSYARLFLGVR